MKVLCFNKSVLGAPGFPSENTDDLSDAKYSFTNAGMFSSA